MHVLNVQIHSTHTYCLHISCKQKLLFWMWLIAINHLTALYIYIFRFNVYSWVFMSIPPYKHMWKWCDIRPSMVTHTLNLCSAFTHSSAHTQQWTHTQSSGQPFMLRCSGSSWRFGALPKGTSSWYWRWRESAVHPPPPPPPWVCLIIHVSCKKECSYIQYISLVMLLIAWK